jgi:murein DD-endopeptidase MepM/ murein hydrolase activator NlpD
MSPANQYKRVENRIVIGITRVLRAVGGTIKTQYRKFIDFGTQRFTVMLIPHSEKKIFNFHISVFSLFFFGILTIGILASFFVLSTRYSGVSNLLTQKDSKLSNTKANLEMVRDEITELRQVSRDFETSMKDTLNSLGFESQQNTGGAAPNGDLASFVNLEKRDQGIMREVSDLRQLKNFMEQSQESFSQIKGLLESHGKLLVDLPTFWPIEGSVGRITNYFGPEVHPFTNQWYLHKGIDIAYRRGKEVVSAANGKVVERKYDPKGFGNYIVIRHAYGFATKYGHLDNVYVEEGDVVTQGQKVGTMGNTGWSTGPHLHFEVRIGSQVVDPERFLNVSSQLK